MKVSTFHNYQLIANTETIGLHNRSDMVAILDM